ncbi:diadenylate cyclase CdaA [Natribacillus halophilus]|uniref:Diadenylate cyclase n=1 Tax=Natribacillus halophilus TaxID=549003 RepID=A0A1G8S3K1_9BACI|nr:diadenylate cyclase CdaA [Natribacillus halophilus]SDJ23834.1 diadenylate cyclase [Natribacillus halophilus]
MFGEEFITWLTRIVDILLVAFVVYKVITIIRGTRAVQLVKGITVILAAWFLSSFFGLQTMQFLMNLVVTYGVLAIIIIFQPEMRRALEQLGRGRLFGRGPTPEEKKSVNTIDALMTSLRYMAKRRIGALISIEDETGMDDYIETGIPIRAHISSELLINIFIPNAPLHDGAVIINNNILSAAACYLPLSENPFISKELGTRHRAAIGVSEVTDALTIVVSEETGEISVTKNGEIHRDIEDERVRKMLENQLLKNVKTSQRWQWGGRKNG